MEQELETLLADLVALTRVDTSALPTFGKTTKLGEEVGELCEAVLFSQGYLQHKTSVGTVLEESADVVLLVMDVLASCYPDHSPARIAADLKDMISMKAEKWQSIMTP